MAKSLSWGSIYTDASITPYSMNACKVDTDKIALSYARVESTVKEVFTRIVTISGNTITFNTEYQATDTYTVELDIRVPPVLVSANKIAVFFKNDIALNGYGVIGDISGNVITFGSEQQFNAVDLNHFDATEIASNKVAVTYGRLTNTYARIATISGTTFTWGTADSYTHSGTNPSENSIAKLDTDKFVMDLIDGNDQDVRAIAGTVSGTTITLGAAINVDLAPTNPPTPRTIQIDTDKAQILYGRSSDRNTRILSASGTTLTANTEFSLSQNDATSYKAGASLSNSATIFIDNDPDVGNQIDIDAFEITSNTVNSRVNDTQAGKEDKHVKALVALDSTRFAFFYKDGSNDLAGKIGTFEESPISAIATQGWGNLADKYLSGNLM